MILRAPAFLVPRTVWGWLPDGFLVGSNPESTGNIYLNGDVNYQIGNSKRRSRFLDLVDAGTDDAPQIEVQEYEELLGNTIIELDRNCYSVKAYKKPSRLSCFFYAEFTAAGINYPRIDIYPARIDSDCLLYDWNGVPKALSPRQTTVTYWTGLSGEEAGYRIICAVGSFFFMQVRSPAALDLGTTYQSRISIAVERECRIYAKSISSLSGNPAIGFTGSGQTFPVSVKGPADVNLACTAGGVLLRGASSEIYLTIHRDDIAPHKTTIEFCVDVEVPYDI